MSAAEPRAPAVVADASPLIVLAAVGALDLLRRLYGVVTIPPRVRREVVDEGGDRPGAREIAAAAWIEVSPVADIEKAEALRRERGLDPGEADAIRLAAELGGRLLADERRARAEAARLGIEVLGTLGVLIEAQRRGLVEDAGPLIQAAARASGRVKESITVAALREAAGLQPKK